MTQISERHVRLLRKDQELERLFELASNRRRKRLQQKNETEENSDFQINYGKKENLILRPLRSSDNLVKTDTNDNKLEADSRQMCNSLQRVSGYYSHQDLPQANLDHEKVSPSLSINRSNNNDTSLEDTAHSNENLNKSGHHNPNFVTYSSSSDEVDISNYCHFIPATSSSTNNTTSSSHYSRTDNSAGKFSSFDPSSSDGNASSVWIPDGNIFRQSSVMFYPSGSPLISHKYQGSPVVRIDNKLRAGEADYVVNRTIATLGKPPIVPRRKKVPQRALTCLATSETRLSEPILVVNTGLPSPISPGYDDGVPTSIIRRTKKKLLEEHMRKRFSVGDYSTRALIEWENNLNCGDVLQLSMSGDLGAPYDRRKLSSESDAPVSENLKPISTVHNFLSEMNIVQCHSTDSFKDTQVSFSLKNERQDDDNDKALLAGLHKPNNFIQRSMNDIAAALRNVTSSEKVPNSKRSVFNNRPHFMDHRIFKKRDSSSSELLYSVPPFARQHMPSDISGAARIISQETYLNTHLPSSTPNLIAELDPTFHERYPLEDTVNEAARHPLSKRNRSYRLSFIENAHTVTTRKLTCASVTTSPSSAAPALRFVQPRRRVPSRNSATIRRHCSQRAESGGTRPRNSKRFSCAQQ